MVCFIILLHFERLWLVCHWNAKAGVVQIVLFKVFRIKITLLRPWPFNRRPRAGDPGQDRERIEKHSFPRGRPRFGRVLHACCMEDIQSYHPPTWASTRTCTSCSCWRLLYVVRWLDLANPWFECEVHIPLFFAKTLLEIIATPCYLIFHFRNESALTIMMVFNETLLVI